MKCDVIDLSVEQECKSNLTECTNEVWMQFYHLKDIMIIAYYCYATQVSWLIIILFVHLSINIYFTTFFHYISEENTVLVI